MLAQISNNLKNLQNYQNNNSIPSFYDSAVKNAFNTIVNSETGMPLINNLSNYLNLVVTIIIMLTIATKLIKNQQRIMQYDESVAPKSPIDAGIIWFTIASIIILWVYAPLFNLIEYSILSFINKQSFVGDIQQKIIGNLTYLAGRFVTMIQLNLWGERIKAMADISIAGFNLKGPLTAAFDTLIPKGYLLVLAALDFVLQFTSFLIILGAFLERSIILLILNMFFPVVLANTLMQGGRSDLTDSFKLFKKYLFYVITIILLYPCLVIAFNFIDIVADTLRENIFKLVTATGLTPNTATVYLNNIDSFVPSADSSNVSNLVQQNTIKDQLKEMKNFMDSSAAYLEDIFANLTGINLLWSLPISFGAIYIKLYIWRTLHGHIKEIF